MRSGMAVVCALGILAGSSSTGLAQRGGRGFDQSARYGWLSSLSAGKAEASRTGKPLMVVVRCVP